MEMSKKKESAKDEERNVNTDDIPADSKEIVRVLKEVVNCSEQEIYAILVGCNMNPDEAIDRLLSQDPFQEVQRKRGKKKETKDTSDSCFQGVGNSIQDNPVNDSNGNKINSDEKSDAQGTHNHSAVSSTMSSILGPYKSDLTNGETKKVPISSGEAAPSFSATSSILGPYKSDVANGENKKMPISSRNTPLSRLISAWDCGISGKRTMADNVKKAIGYSKESVTESPDKDDCILLEKSFSNSFTDSASRPESASISNRNMGDEDVIYPSDSDAAGRGQLGESSDSISNQNLENDDYGGSRLLCDEQDNNKNNETCQVQRRYSSDDNNQTKEPSSSVLASLHQLSIEKYDQEASFEEDETSRLPSQSLIDDSKDIHEFSDEFSLKDLSTIRDDEEEKKQWRDGANETQHEPAAIENQHSESSSSAATDFTFSQRLDIALAAIQNDKLLQAYTRGPDPQDSDLPLDPFNQSVPTTTNQSITNANASSNGRKPSISMTEALKIGASFVPQKK